MLTSLQKSYKVLIVTLTCGKAITAREFTTAKGVTMIVLNYVQKENKTCKKGACAGVADG